MLFRVCCNSCVEMQDRKFNCNIHNYRLPSMQMYSIYNARIRHYVQQIWQIAPILRHGPCQSIFSLTLNFFLSHETNTTTTSTNYMA